MIKHNLQRGQEVRIIDHTYTEKTQGMGGRSMHNMVGNVYKIREAYRDCIIIGGFYWDPRDIRPTEPAKLEPEIFHYDVSTLEGVE